MNNNTSNDASCATTITVSLLTMVLISILLWYLCRRKTHNDVNSRTNTNTQTILVLFVLLRSLFVMRIVKINWNSHSHECFHRISIPRLLILNRCQWVLFARCLHLHKIVDGNTFERNLLNISIQFYTRVPQWNLNYCSWPLASL